MILTITLNPAVDKTIKISDLKVGEVNRVDYLRIDAGGKGINVSKTIKELKGESIALGFLGGNSGEWICSYLNKVNVKNDFVTISGETRTNIKIIDTVNTTYTDINENGPTVTKEEVQAIKDKISTYLNKDAIIVLSGSMPAGIDETFYAQVIQEANEREAKVILDAEGKVFVEAIKAGPFMVKPNLSELEKAFGIKIDTEEKLIKTAKDLLDYGIKYVVVSMGADGSVVVSKDTVIKAKGMKVEVKSTVGAGDSMVGALALSLEKGCKMEEALKLAAATSTANVMSEGSQTGRLDVINDLIKKIEITEI